MNKKEILDNEIDDVAVKLGFKLGYSICRDKTYMLEKECGTRLVLTVYNWQDDLGGSYCVEERLIMPSGGLTDNTISNIFDITPNHLGDIDVILKRAIEKFEILLQAIDQYSGR